MDEPSALTPSFYERLVALERERVGFVLVTLVEAVGSVPQDAGAKMLVTSGGVVAGTVGGGRVEAQAIARAQEMLGANAAGTAAPQFVSWTLKGDVGMTCGGAVKLYFEPHPSPANRWTIAIFGAGHIVQALLPVLIPLSCEIRCFDPRPDWIGRAPRAPNLRAECRDDLAAAVDQLPDHAFVLCMTQGHKTDRPILHRALTTRHFPFIGVIGSDSKAEILRRELVAEGVPPELVATFHCPVGLPFGTNHPHEIALSIAAQLVAERDRSAK